VRTERVNKGPTPLQIHYDDDDDDDDDLNVICFLSFFVARV
jgi:hypothetical protein